MKKYFVVNLKTGTGEISDLSLTELEKDKELLILETTNEEYDNLLNSHNSKINQKFKLSLGELFGIKNSI